jgi:hypothetical protein
MVMIQRPSTLDSVCALALVQEEAMDSRKTTSRRRFEPSSSRLVHKPVNPMQVSPLIDKSVGVSHAEDRRSVESAWSSSADDKMRALKQYRHARGLCKKYAEKWSHGHRCAQEV